MRAFGWRLLGLCALVVGFVPSVSVLAEGEIRLPPPAQEELVVLAADAASRWTQGKYEVRHLQGHVAIRQGGRLLRADEAVVWVQQPSSFSLPTKLVVFVEGTASRPVAIEHYQHANSTGSKTSLAPPEKLRLAREQAVDWFGRLYTTGGVQWRTPTPVKNPAAKPSIFDRGYAGFGVQMNDGPATFQRPIAKMPSVDVLAAPSIAAASIETPSPQTPAYPVQQTPFVEDPFGTSASDQQPVQPAQFGQPAQFSQSIPFNQPALAPTPTPLVANPTGFRRIRVGPRGDANIGGSIEYVPSETGETTAVAIGGFRVIIEGVQIAGLPGAAGPIDSVDLEADRVVLWAGSSDVSIGSEFEIQNDVPFELYLEGNIVFRQGDRTIYADRMYYDVRRKLGVVLNAELLTPLPEVEGYSYPGLVRLKAGVLRQLDESRFVASDALFTTSRLEEPTYHLGSETIAFQDIRQPVMDPFTGQQAVDPATGTPLFEHERLATSKSNRLYLGGVPVFYWPTIATDLEEPSYYITDLKVGNDSIFGFQTLVDFDIYQLFGTKGPEGTDWDLSLDYLSDRGFGYGTTFEYGIDSFAGVNGPAVGRADLWAINDNGIDNLGFGRRTIIPEQTYRGRAFWNHQQKIADGILEGWTAQAEVGWISDRTFLEQFYEAEWDENKDQTTGGRLRRINDNRSLTIEANARLNDFFTQTQWLPRLDHYVMGQELLGDTLTWFAHSSAGYANLNVAEDPSNPELLGQFNLFPWEVNAAEARISGEGERFATRQEIDLPINAAPFKIVPFALGEVAHWGADLNGNDIQRAYVNAGVRASIPFWAVNPAIRDPLFNLNGLAHKVVFDAELSFADATRNYDELPLYDEIEDDSLEALRRRLFEPEFAGDLANFYSAAPGISIAEKYDPRFYAIRSGIGNAVASPSTELVDDLTVARLGMRHRLQTKRGAPGQEHLVDWLTFDANAAWFPNENRDNIGQDFGLLDYDLQWRLGDRFSIISDGYADVFGDGLRTVSGGFRINRPTKGNIQIGYRTIRGPFSADLLTATVNYRLSPKWIASAYTVLDFSEAGNIGQSFAMSRLGESINTTIGINVDESKDNVGIRFSIEPRFLPRSSLTRRTGIDVPPAGAEYLE